MRSRAAGLRLGWERGLRFGVLPLVAAAGSAIAGRALAEPEGLTYLVPLAAAALVIGVGVIAPRGLLYALVVWLTALGFIRRIGADLGTTPLGDPLLLIGPVAIGVLVVVAAHRGAFRDRSKLANGVLVLSLLMLGGAVNPLQGSLLAGAAGLLFSLVPMLAFWIGRSLIDDVLLRRILKLVVGLAVGTALYGLVQTFVGFPSWDAAWLAAHKDDFQALVVDGVVTRPFGTFSSPAEYSFYLGIGVVIAMGVAFRLTHLPFAAGAAVLFGAGILYISSRSVVVLLVFAAGLMLGAWFRLPIGLSGVLSVALPLTIPLVASSLAPTEYDQSGRSQLISHQISGLANPEESTLGGHLFIVGEGFSSALDNPLGLGIGATTLAGSKFGGLQRGTEQDPSNVAAALGIPGVLVYAFVLGLAVWSAYKLVLRRHDRLSLVVLGILALTVFQWMNGGHYAVSFLVWILLGWVDRTAYVSRAPR